MRRALAAVAAVVLFVMGMPGTAGAATESDGFVRYALPAHATAAELWVEVESPGLSAADVVIEVDGTEHTPVATPLGVTLVVPASGAAQEVAVAVRVASTPDVALTVIDADGTILHSQHERITVTADPGGGTPTPDPGASATPVPSASATPGLTAGGPAGGGDEGGALATTGSDAGMAGWTALVAALALALGVALVARRTVRGVGAAAVGAAAIGERSSR